jgi:hypothetical protein
MEGYAVLTDVCTNEKDILIQFCDGCFINRKQGVLRYELYYITYHRKYFWTNILYNGTRYISTRTQVLHKHAQQFE